MTEKMQTRAATIAGASTVDADKRTVSIVWTTGAAVKRFAHGEGYYMEELAVDRRCIRLERFETMSLLDSHEQSMDSRLGTVVPGSVKVEGGKGLAVIRFSRNAKADAIFRDLVDGHPVNISVGYRIHNSERTEGFGDTLPVIRATDWEPLELSIVAVPADPGAISRKDPDMPTNTNRQPGPLTPAEVSEQTRRLIEAERFRANEIRALARNAGHSEDDAFVANALAGDTSVSDFKSILLDMVMARPPVRSNTATVETWRRQDETETMRNLAANAILHRHNVVDKLEDGAREWRGLTAVDIARETLRQRNDNYRGTPAEVVERALHTTSDFVAIMNSVTSLSLMTAYSAYENTFQLIANKVTVQDFREAKVIDVGSAPDLLPLNEHGEMKSGTIRESEEGIQIATFGRTIGLTRQLIINDRLDAFTQAVSKHRRHQLLVGARFRRRPDRLSVRIHESRPGARRTRDAIAGCESRPRSRGGGEPSGRSWHHETIGLLLASGFDGERSKRTPAGVIGRPGHSLKGSRHEHVRTHGPHHKPRCRPDLCSRVRMPSRRQHSERPPWSRSRAPDLVWQRRI